MCRASGQSMEDAWHKGMPLPAKKPARSKWASSSDSEEMGIPAYNPDLVGDACHPEEEAEGPNKYPCSKKRAHGGSRSMRTWPGRWMSRRAGERTRPAA